MPDLGEWKLNRIETARGDQIAMDFSVIGDEGAEQFLTSMPFDEARQFAYAILSLTGIE